MLKTPAVAAAGKLTGDAVAHFTEKGSICLTIVSASVKAVYSVWRKKARKVSARAHTWALPIMESIIM